MKIIGLTLENYKSYDHLVLAERDFSDFLVFTGRNGTGKTSLLEAIALSLKTGGINDNSVHMLHPYVGQRSEAGKVIAKFRLSKEEVAFVSKKFQELKTSQQLGGSSIYYDDTTPSEFESIVDFYQYQGSTSMVNFSQTYVTMNVSNIPETVNKRLKHPLAALVERNLCLSVAFFNAFRQPELNETQMFSQMPAVPFSPNSFANPTSLHGNNELRQTMSFQLLQAFNSIVTYEALQHLNKDEYKKSLALVLEPEFEAVNELLSPKKLLVPEFIAEENRLEYSVEVGSQKHPIKALSSGENELLILSTYILRAIGHNQLNGIVPIILIDEPELHLHSVYVERLAKFMLSRDFSGTNCLIASHSPDFINEFDTNLRKIEFGDVSSIRGLEQRKELFRELGRKITPSALVENVVFTEGSIETTKKLHDEQIYQRILDKDVIKTLFVSVGDNQQTSVAGKITQKFIDSITRSGTDNKIFMLIDGDDKAVEWTGNSKGSSTNSIIQLNVYHVENLLLDIAALSEATRIYGRTKSPIEVDTIIKSFLPSLVEPTVSTLRRQLTHRAQTKFFDGLREDVRPLLRDTELEAKLEDALAEVDKSIETYRIKLAEAVDSEEWRRLFKGADILRKFNQYMNTETGTSIGYVELQSAILEFITFDKLLPSTQGLLEMFRPRQ